MRYSLALIVVSRLTGGPHADPGRPTPEQDAEPRLRKPHLQIPGADADLTAACRKPSGEHTTDQ